MSTTKYPRPLTDDMRKFKFSLHIDTVGKVAKYAKDNEYPNVAEALEDIIESYFAQLDRIDASL
jgi:hypothetical protein